MNERLDQVGALPYRVTSAGDLELLLVTSRGTKQWIIPKGHRMEGKTASEAAAQEAYEEAGVFGTMSAMPIGEFQYDKTTRLSPVAIPASVEVYAMRVNRQLTYWPEALQRKQVWTTIGQALELIINPTLRTLVDTFGQTFPFDES